MDPLNLEKQIVKDLDAIESSLNAIVPDKDAKDADTQNVADTILESYKELNRIVPMVDRKTSDLTTINSRIGALNERVRNLCRENVFDTNTRPIQTQASILETNRPWLSPDDESDVGLDDLIEDDAASEKSETTEKKAPRRTEREERGAEKFDLDELEVSSDSESENKPVEDEKKGFFSAVKDYFWGS